jgi:DNA-binding MarR family transcriptional regulator
VNNKTKPSADRDYDLWVLLAQVRDVILEARENELRQYDVTAWQAAVLFIIDAAGGTASPADIARWSLRKPNSVSGILDRMKNAALIRVAKDTRRKNMKVISISEKGYEVLQNSMKRESIHQIMSCLTADQYQQFKGILEKLRSRGFEVIGSQRNIPFPQTSIT